MKKISLFLFFMILIFPASFVRAEGKFDYIVIRGLGITEDINVSDPALTQDYFAFADFSQGSINPPADPGIGYQVVRMYAKNSKGVPYDQLHYYPDSGTVYYDGIVDGFSDYGTKWYKANPAVEKPFRSALAQNARLTWVPFAVFAVLIGAFFIAYQRRPKPQA